MVEYFRRKMYGKNNLNWKEKAKYLVAENMSNDEH